MAVSPLTSIAPPVADINRDINSKAEQRFRFYLHRCFAQFALIAGLAIAPYFLFVGIAHTNIPDPAIANSEQPLPSSQKHIGNIGNIASNPNTAAPYPISNPSGNAINTALAALLGGGGLVALWRAKNETDAKAHEFSIKLLTMQKELLESNRTEVVKYFESRTEGITNELRLIRDRLVILEREVSQLHL